MVGKLIKHEMLSTLRIAAIPAIIMILLAVLSRIMIETSSINVSAIILIFYFFAVCASLFIGYFFGVYSFYQALFTGTGYLTLSLPVTPDQLIWSKLLSAIIVMFASSLVCILSACIFFIGLPIDILQAISNVASLVAEWLSQVEPLAIVELVIWGIVSIPMMFLVFYAVMCIGQLFTVKNRKGIAILLYIGLIFVWNILSQAVFSFIDDKMLEVSIHLYLWVKIVFTCAVDVGCYFIVRYIIRNKVNLLA